MAAENVVLEPHAKRRRWEPASVAGEMLQEVDDDDGLERGVTVVGVTGDDVVDGTSRQVLCTQQMLLTQQMLYTPFRCNFDIQRQNVGASEVGANFGRPCSRKSAEEL